MTNILQFTLLLYDKDFTNLCQQFYRLTVFGIFNKFILANPLVGLLAVTVWTGMAIAKNMDIIMWFFKEGVFNIRDDIYKLIKDIPGIGFAFEAVEAMVKGATEQAFKAVEAIKYLAENHTWSDLKANINRFWSDLDANVYKFLGSVALVGGDLQLIYEALREILKAYRDIINLFVSDNFLDDLNKNMDRATQEFWDWIHGRDKIEISTEPVKLFPSNPAVFPSIADPQASRSLDINLNITGDNLGDGTKKEIAREFGNFLNINRAAIIGDIA